MDPILRAGKRDVRMEGAGIGRESRLRGSFLHLFIKGGEFRSERYAGEEDSCALEEIQLIDLDGNGWRLNSAETG